MKSRKKILFTAGRGPEECQYAVFGIHLVFKKFLAAERLDYKISTLNQGNKKETIETVIFEINVEKSQIDFANWIGTIKWIGESPFRKNHKRKNWFIKSAEISIGSKLLIDYSQVKYQAFRASGPGGQHRNKVATAIRATHEKTGISTVASDGKSQSQNKKKALEKLKIKIASLNQHQIDQANIDQWISQINIERGNPVKIFKGFGFKQV